MEKQGDKGQEAQEAKPAEALRKSPSNGTVYHDFDVVAVLVAWIRHQKVDMGLARVLFTALTNIIVESVAIGLLITVIIGLLLEDHIKIMEVVYMMSIWLLCASFTIFLKLSFQRTVHKPEVFCSNQFGGFWNALLLTLKPLKYFRAFYHRRNKMTVLGKDFNHGETVTGQEFRFMIRINREELVDARDDVHDAFLFKIPMALLQFYYFSHSPSTPNICNFIDACRIFIVVFYLVFTIRSVLTYEWKKKLYLDSVHVEGYLKTNGRLPVPKWIDNNVLYFLRAVSISTSILSRFFLICFMARVSGGLGLFCIIFLFGSNWLVVVLCPCVLATTENLPLGVTIPAAYAVNRWINTFVGMDTRFNELSRSRIKLGFCKTRVPFVLVQMVTFVIAFLVQYCAVEIIELSTPDILESLDYMENGCDNSEQLSTFAQTAGTCISAVIRFLHIVCYDPVHQFYASIHFHWTLMYLHTCVTLLYNFYSSYYVEAKSHEDSYPPMISLYLFKHIFQFFFTYEHPSNRGAVVSQLLFLMSLNLKQFNSIHGTFSQEEETEVRGISKWWEAQILQHVQSFSPGSGRYRDNSPEVPNLENLPVEPEIHAAYKAMEELPFSNRLYLLCGTKIDEIVRNEMTSKRLQATMEMLQLPKREILRRLENTIICGDYKRV